jgi:uncharacterized protein with ATP-grasp and redox domains
MGFLDNSGDIILDAVLTEGLRAIKKINYYLRGERKINGIFR